MKRYPAIIIFTLLFAIGYMSVSYAGTGEFYGTVVGAGLGGFAGNQFGHRDGRVVATTSGVLIGGLIGNNIGHSMDRSVSVSSWNPNYGAGYYGAPSAIAFPAYVPNYVAPPELPSPPPIYIDQKQHSYCREYSEVMQVNGVLQESYGTACLQPDGNWKTVN